MNGPHILHVTETLRGGTASYLQEIVPPQAVALGRDRVHLLVPGSQADELRACAGLDVRHFDDRRSRALRVPTLAAAYLRVHAALRPDLVHVHGSFAGVAVRAAHSLAGHRSRLVYCAHGWAFDRRAPAWSCAMAASVERLLAPAADAIVCISDHDRRSAIAHGLRPDRLVTLHNAIGPAPQPDRRIDWPEGRRRILFVGRFDRQKGVDVLVEAMRSVGDRGYAWLAGSPVVAEQTLGALPSNVGVTGWLDRVALQAYYESADVVVVPSRWEGFGLVAVEAMRASRAVVASRVGGLPEVVLDGVTGRLVDAESPAALAQALTEPDDASLREMGRRGRSRWAERYAMTRLDEQLRGLYAKLVDGERGRIAPSA
ncbi:MAG: glycosyltransferase [Burkholderiales bacterium]|jgi:glycosyltransferase involved in cell wall biosynthesis